MKEINNVVAYCRYSSENQRDGYSIEAQKKAISDYCKRMNYSLLRFYVDEAKTGMNDNREEFQAMIADSSSKEFSAVIVHKLDRFSRDRYNSVFYRKKLKDNGVKLISVLENIDDDNPEDLILLSVLEGMADYYSKNLSREVKKGMNAAASKGLSTGGIPPFGYRINQETKKLEIIPERAEIVKIMFNMYAKGYNLVDIEMELNSLGYKTIHGNLWDKKQIRKILQKEAYTGVKVYNKYAYKSASSVKSPLIRVEDAFPRIISNEVWNAVQNRFLKDKRTIKPRKNMVDYLFTGLLQCKNCGGNLTGCSSFKNQNGERIYHHYYVCSGKQKTRIGKCPTPRFPKDLLENHIITTIIDFIFTDESIGLWADAILKSHNKSSDIKDIDTLKLQLSKVKNQEERLLDLYLSGDIEKDKYNTKIYELKLQSSKLETDILYTSSSHSFTKEELCLAIRLMMEDLKSDATIKTKKGIVNTFVKKISIDNESIDIELTLPNLEGAYNGLNGGADGIRTHAPVTRSTSLAGKPLEPLEYYSNYQALLHYIVKHSACQMIFAVNLWQLPFLQSLLEPLDYSSNIPLYSLYLEQSLFRYRRTMLQTY